MRLGQVVHHALQQGSGVCACFPTRVLLLSQHVDRTCTRCTSSSREALWSLVSTNALPLRPSTARESPAAA
jgi:hypothetical protein